MLFFKKKSLGFSLSFLFLPWLFSSDLYYFLSSVDSGLYFPFFITLLDDRFDYLFEAFLLSWVRSVFLQTSPLWLLFAVVHRFCRIIFLFLFKLLSDFFFISSLSHWFFSSILFSNLVILSPVFSLCLVSSFIVCD